MIWVFCPCQWWVPKQRLDGGGARCKWSELYPVFILHFWKKNLTLRRCLVSFFCRLYVWLNMPPCGSVVPFSPDSPFSLISSLTLSNNPILGLPLILLPCTSISIALLSSALIFSSHAHTTSTSFPGLSLRFHPFSLSDSLISYPVELCNRCWAL